jgi:DNA polymerase-3 subunit chi
MTRVDFHTGVGDKVDFACRLIRKAYLAGQPVVVVAPDETLRVVDQRLWTFSALDFVPHCMAGSELAAVTPVILSPDTGQAPHYQVLLNLGDAVPSSFARFERLLEVVGEDGEDVRAARDRYRFYRDRGYPLNNYRRDA